MSATDPDDPIGGHSFSFSLAQEAAGKANFSVRDNKGNKLSAHVPTHQINFHLPYNSPTRLLQWNPLPVRLTTSAVCTLRVVIY